MDNDREGIAPIAGVKPKFAFCSKFRNLPTFMVNFAGLRSIRLPPEFQHILADGFAAWQKRLGELSRVSRGGWGCGHAGFRH
jgi:hypothetical protein